MAATTVKLYTNPICPFAHRALLTVEELGIPVETHFVPLSGEISRAEKDGNLDGLPLPTFEGKTVDDLKRIKEEYKASINASGEVPTVVIGDARPVLESEIAAEYLALTFNSPLIPKDPLDVARWRHSLKVSADLITSFYRLLMSKKAEEDGELADKINANLKKLVGVISPEGPYILGAEFSIADILLMPFFSRFQHTLSHYRNFTVPGTAAPSDSDDEVTKRLAQWWNAVKSRPSLTKTEVASEPIIKAYESYAAR